MSAIKYRAFINVVEHGSLTNAAKVMGYSQPGVSKMIDSLEKDLNIKLFTRNSSSLVLTENGTKIYQYCKKIVANEDELFDSISEMQGLLTGSLRIASLNSISVDFVPRVINNYKRVYPNIDIQLEELCTYDIIDQLKTDLLDIGFTSSFESSSLDFIPLFTDPIRLIVSDKHPFASRTTISISELNDCDFIMPTQRGNDLVIKIQDIKPFNPTAKFYVHSDIAAISMVASNSGAYIISDMQCNNLPDSVRKLNFEENAYRTIGIALKTQKNKFLRLKEMIRIAKDEISL